MIRLARHADGTPGLASGWLTQDCAIGGEVAMRLRTNSGFHGPSPETPMILIGAGTGLAGLRTHIKERPAGCETWLLFGERTRAHDAFFDDELQGWVASGVLTRLDRCFSRDVGDGRYVQHLIAAHADALSAWVARGAAVYVWHCDAEGNYSMYGEGIEDETYLRGVQIAGDDGVVRFTSIMPGCYSGRWPHIHFEVFPDKASISDATNNVLTSQLAIPEDVATQVYALTGYTGSASNLAKITLGTDNVFSDGWDQQVATVTGDASSGYTVSIDVPIDTTTEQEMSGGMPGGGAGGPGGGTPPDGEPGAGGPMGAPPGQDSGSAGGSTEAA